ncbi:putative RNA-directed DNA polymerase from transposon BS, partial [Varanus komodoensis]
TAVDATNNEAAFNPPSLENYGYPVHSRRNVEDPLFRPGYSTESALVALYDDLCREKDRGSASLLVLLDLLAAFDTIDHGILLDRLAGLGVGGTALQWFCSYLNDRFQKVVLGDYGSAPWQLCHGVPQGSILSPLLFNIYMKPLGEVIRRCGLRNHQYADDTQLYLSFSTNPGEAVAVLNRCLAEVMGWMRANKLKLNPDKTEVLLVGGSGFGEGGVDLVLNGATLPLRDKVRSLGVLLDLELSLEAQVTAVARSAFLQLRLINQLRPYLEFDCLATVTHALVTSRLDFCNVLYVGLPLKTVRTLQLVQNRAARLLTGTGRYAHMTPVLHQLHWLPIEARAQFKVLIMTYKVLNGLGPGYLNECLRPYMPDRPLRSAGESLLREPSMKEIRRVNTRRRVFSAVAPNLWNSLPKEVRLAPSLLVFRRQLNPDKMEVLLVGGSDFGEGDLDLVLNGVALPLKDKVRSLGVLLDPELLLEAQVTAVARSAFFQLQLIHQLRPYLENDCLATVTHALDDQEEIQALLCATADQISRISERVEKILDTKKNEVPPEKKSPSSGFLRKQCSVVDDDDDDDDDFATVEEKYSMILSSDSVGRSIGSGMRERKPTPLVPLSSLPSHLAADLGTGKPKREPVAIPRPTTPKYDKLGFLLKLDSKLLFLLVVFNVPQYSSIGFHCEVVNLDKTLQAQFLELNSINQNSLPELTEIVSELVLKTPRMLVLGDFNLHAETVLTGVVLDFMTSMAAMGLSQHVIGPTHERGHTLDLVFSTGQEEGDLRVRNYV